jgi:hypothetical protein
MSKNIVFCADGTWNGPGEQDSDNASSPPTNVFKIFLNLSGTDTLDTLLYTKERERVDALAQISKYLYGVGDSTNILDRLIGGGFGAGLITRIVRGYTFVSRNYQPGDKIYLIGFSRGAYTARALAGLISAKGLLTSAAVDFDDKAAAYRAGAAVWFQWRHDVRQAKGDPLDHFEAMMLDLPGFLLNPPAAATLVAAPIEAVAVWDTVGALGIPVFTGQHVDVDLFQFADTALSANVHFGRHAISIDEQREDFTPTLWDADPRITQVLFPGAHADVGGGYPVANEESGLSDGALFWMTGQLAALGVRFSAVPAVPVNPDAGGKGHWPWLSPVWQVLPRAARQLPPGLGLARSVVDRMNLTAVFADPSQPAGPYRPGNIRTYLNETWSGPAPGIEPA